MDKIEIDAICLKQPIGEFYIGVMDAEDLVNISFSDVRRMKREVEDYLGIQRELKENRRKEINEYITTLDATFPNSIIVAIKGKYVSFDNGKMTLAFEEFEKKRLAKVLDGQHRLAGFDETNYEFEDKNGKKQKFQLLVTIFVEADLSTQAKVFAMVNQNQTKVNPSLVYDLESLSTSRSPDKTAHQIAVLLNKSDKGPFHNRIKRLGVKTVDDTGHSVVGEMLTQAAFVSNLVKLISPKPKEDRNLLLGKKKKFLSFGDKKFDYMDEKDFYRCVFRKCFTENKDELIALFVENYFEAVMDIWSKEWDVVTRDSVLNKTVGFIALMRFLRLATNTIRELGNLDQLTVITKEQYKFILETTLVPGSYFYTIDAVSKSSGEVFNKLKNNLLKTFEKNGEINYVAAKAALDQIGK
ncbi:hypothetical protein CWB73_02230 [Pseudoalteromonas phenolica]|uniref:DGQHR domain-containing protein n=1 Tax=Pseudoalteromonas phenolica TaxID=161398 RepID=A0A5S3YXN1_9GAMM|nr:DGQHR domain-containing protein [Pseudoalteromonas phenolica]TMP83310.1 hypothetical protein CWB73_02230 [Pseudoalteromonas phenolica]